MDNDSVKTNTHIFISYVYKNEDSQFTGSMPSAHTFWFAVYLLAFFPSLEFIFTTKTRFSSFQNF